MNQEVLCNEDDVSAEEAAEKQGARLQKENVHKIGQKGFSEKKSKRQKVVNRVIPTGY